MDKLRVKRNSPLEDVATEIWAHQVSDGRTEVCIDQSTYKHLTKRYAPSRMVIFYLTPDERAKLIEMLMEGAPRTQRSDRDDQADP